MTTATVGGTLEIGDKFLVQITGEDGSTKTVSTTCTTTSTSTTATEIAANCELDTDPLFTAINFTVVGSGVVMTAATAGVPFVATVSTTENNDGVADNQTFVAVAGTASRGPQDWNTIGNWSDGVKPVSTDTVIIDGRAANSIIYGLAQTSVTLTALTIYRSMAYDIGTITAHLRISATNLKIGVPPEDGSSPTGAAVYIDTGTNASTVEIYGSKDTGESGIEPVVWKGVHASNAVRLLGGIMGIATLKPGDVATCPTIHVEGDSTRLHCSSDCTLTTVNQYGGRVLLNGAATTFNQWGGSAETRGSGAYTTLNVHGNFALNSTGSVTTMNVEGAGSVNTTVGSQARTVATFNLKGISARLQFNTATFAPPIAFSDGASMSQVESFGDGTIAW